MQTFEQMEAVYNNAPQKIKNLIDNTEPTYKGMEALCKKLKKHGYVANFGLDGELTELKKVVIEKTLIAKGINFKKVYSSEDRAAKFDRDIPAMFGIAFKNIPFVISTKYIHNL